MTPGADEILLAGLVSRITVAENMIATMLGREALMHAQNDGGFTQKEYLKMIDDIIDASERSIVVSLGEEMSEEDPEIKQYKTLLLAAVRNAVSISKSKFKDIIKSAYEEE